MVEILFVHPNASEIIYQGLASDHSAIEPPIWAAMLANSVRIAGHETSLIDAEVERFSYQAAVDKISEYDAKIVCFVVYGQQPSASSQNMTGACATAELLKKTSPKTFILFVGGHVAALPVETIRNEPAIDAVCHNEGVYTIRALLQVDDLSDESRLRKVPGLCFRSEEGNIVKNPPSALVKKSELEHDLPGMAWDLLPELSRYRTAGWHSWTNSSVKQPFAAIYTSLGCPYRCSFCMINIINRTDNSDGISSADSNIFRSWNPNFIIRQFDYLAEHGVKNIKIADELFVLNPNHFVRLCDLIIERGYDFNIWAYSRIDTCKPEYLETLRKAGVRWLGLGIENPNTILRREIHKDGYQEIRIVDLINEMKAQDICIGGNYIFGLPNDTQESMQETLDFALENITDMSNMYCAMAYPGSPLHLQAKRDGIALPTSYAGYSQHAYETLNMANKNLSAAEILEFRDYAWTLYHSNPSYLQLLENKFGPGARENMENTLKTKLKRKLLEG